MDAAAVRERLRRLRTDADALEFFGDLGYSYADNAPVSTDDWPENTRELPADHPKYLAQHPEYQPDFHVIYCELPGDRLLRADQRPIIDQVARRHPFFMIVFRNQPHDRDDVMWEFVNVRVAEGTNRRLIRRISIGPSERLHDRLYTAAQRLAQIDINQRPAISPLELQILHDRAFDVEAVTNAFFATYDKVFRATETSITGINDDSRRLFTQKLFNRLMFIVFLEHKGWLQFQGRPDYLYALWEDYQRNERARGESSFYEARLIPLFFTGLNTSNEVNIMGAGGHNQGMMQRLIGDVPYLNGGLFEEDEDDHNPAITVPDKSIERILNDLFYHFNFTVAESTPQEIEVAVDPEMLGRIFEELVTGRHETGSYYTPKPVVSFMGREALKGYLQTACPGEKPDALAAFVDQHDPDSLSNSEAVLDALKTVRICDPACGSGAYLLGMLHELIELRTCLFHAKKLDPLTVYQRKLDIIQHNIYGVDIDPFAVNIARLRLWLSLIVDFEGDNPPPLPNLKFKIEVGDSLIAPDPSLVWQGNKIQGVQLDLFRQPVIDDFLRLKAEYLTAHGSQKTTLEQQINDRKTKITAWLHEGGAGEGFDWAVEFAEVFSTANGAGGFDIVLANPPYVRQELIKDQKPAFKRVYGNLYTGTADLYVYFYLRALQLLKPGGMLAFISSNKWLRAGYGEKLRVRLAANTTLYSLIDFGDLPLFGAIAYPVIVIARQQQPPNDDGGPQALTVRSLDILGDLTAAVRAAFFVPQRSLRADGWQLANTQTLDLMDKLRAAGLSLGEYVSERFYRGIVTGLNEAFVIDRATRDRLIAEDPHSAEIIKPWLRGRDVKRWCVEWAGLYLIYAPWELSLEQYPSIASHLEQFRKSLTDRPEVREGRFPWYALSRYGAEYVAEFERPKIVYPDIGDRPEFAFDDRKSYMGNTLYFLPDQPEFVLGTLNSKVIEYFYSHISTKIQQGYLRFFKPYMEQLPIPTPSSDLRTDIESVVHQLLAVRGKGPRVDELEAELNRLVYQAYDLTPAEIVLIEK